MLLPYMSTLLRNLRSQREIIFVCLILLLAFVLRFSTYSANEFHGFDPYVHYSVVEQALANNELPIMNEKDGCPEGIFVNHPVGFYLPPFILGKFISLKLAFALSSVLAGVATILLVYLIFKKVFNRRTATIGTLFLAISFAHIQSSHAGYFRGENFILPFMLLSLLFGLKFLTDEKKWLPASLAAVFSAATVLFWPGYPYALLVYILSVALFITYDFIHGGKIKQNSNFAIFSFGLQFVLVKVTNMLLTVPEHIFSTKFYLPLVLVAILFLFSLRIFNRYTKGSLKHRLFFIGALVAAVFIIALIKKDTVVQLSTGFGLLKATTAFYKNIIELRPMSIQDWFSNFWIIPLFSILGLLTVLKPTNKKIFLFGAVIPGIYLLTTTVRFIFLGSVLFVPLIGITFSLLRRVHKKGAYGLLLGLFVLTAIHGISATAQMRPAVHPDMLQAFDDFRENTEETSCLITIPDWGGMTQYYAKRASYISSTNQALPRFDRFNRFLFTNESFVLLEEGYVGIMPDDFRKIGSLIVLSGVQGLSAEQLVLVDKKTNTSGDEENTYLSVNKRKYVVQSVENEVTAKRLEKKNPSFIQTVFIENNGVVHTAKNDEAEDKGCLYLSDYVTAYFNQKLCTTNIIRMLTQQPVAGLEHWYSFNNVRIYKTEK